MYITGTPRLLHQGGDGALDHITAVLSQSPRVTTMLHAGSNRTPEALSAGAAVVMYSVPDRFLGI